MNNVKLLVLVLAATVFAVPAEPCEAASKEQIREWIVQLGSSNEKTHLNAKKNLCLLPPKQITDPLIAALKSDAWEARAGAADVLGQIKATKAVEPICKLLKDKIWTVRLHAARSLGQLKDPRANKALTAALKDPDNVISVAAMRALVDIGHFSTDVFVTAMTMANPAIRSEAIAALHKRKAKGMYKHYLKALSDKDASVRRAALYAVAYPPIADSKAVAPLIKLLEDKGDTPQRTATLLGIIGDKAAVEPLRQTMWNHRDVHARRAAIEALVRLEAEKMIPTLIELLGRQKDTRSTTLRAMRWLCDRRFVNAILEVLSDDRKRIRSQAVAILGCLNDKNAVGPLIKLLENDPEPSVRLEAVKALGRLGDERAIDPLIHAMTHPKYHIRQAAVTSLGVIGGKKVFETLMIATKNTDAKVRARAICMLGETGDKRAYKSLLAALGDKDYFVLCAAVRTMRTMGDERAIEPMRRILRTRRGGRIRYTRYDVDGRKRSGGFYSDTFLRWETVKVLAEVGRERAVPALIEALGDPDDGVVLNAARALGELGDKRAIKPLSDVMLKNTGKLARAGAFIGLHKLGERPAFLPGLELLKNVRNDKRRQEVAEILASLADKSCIDTLITRLSSKDQNERTAAAIVLGYTKNPRAVKPLIKCMGDTSVRNQRFVAEALGRTGDKRAVATLCDLLKDKNKQVIRAAAKALGNIGDKRAVEPLLEALTSPSLKRSDWTQRLVAEALVQIGDPRVLKHLLKSMKSNYDLVDAVAAMKDKRAIKPLWEAWRRANYNHQRFAILKALVRLDPENSIDRLEKAASTGYDKAIKILGDLGKRRSIPVLKHALHDEDSRVRAAAREALKKIMEKKGT